MKKYKFYINLIWLLVSGMASHTALWGAVGLPTVTTSSKALTTADALAQEQQRANLLHAINVFLGARQVTTYEQLKPIVDLVQRARDLLLEDDKALDQALKLIEKAQELPGSQTIITPGVIDRFGHTARFSIWRMLKLVQNGKDPLVVD